MRKADTLKPLPVPLCLLEGRPKGMMACDDGHIDGMAGGSDAGGEDAVGADDGVLGVRVRMMVVTVGW